MSAKALILICSADDRLAGLVGEFCDVSARGRDGGPAAIVLDLGRRPHGVAASVAAVRRRYPATPIVAVGGHADPRPVVEAIRAGAHDWVDHPARPRPLRRAVEEAILRRDVVEESRHLLSILERRSREVEADRRRLGEDLAELGSELETANARLETAHSELQGRVAQLVMLYRIGRDLSGERNWDQSLDQFLSNVTTFLRADGAGLLLFSQGGRVLAPRSSAGLSDELLQGACATLSTAHDREAGEPALFPLETYRGESGPIRCVEHRSPWNYTVLPLRKRDRDLGYLLIAKEYPGDIHDDLYFLITVQTILAEEVAGAQAVSQLRRLQQFQASTLDHVASGIVTLDAEGRLLYANRKAQELLGGDRSGENLGDRLSMAAGEDLASWLSQEMPRTVAEGWLAVGAEEPVPVALRAAPLPGELPHQQRFVAILDDLRSSHQLEAERRRAARQDELLIMAAEWAHDVRTPLTGILHGAELLSGALPADASEQRHYEMIRQEVQRLNGLVANFLDFARPVRLSRSATDAEELVREVADLMFSRAAEADVRLHCQIAPLPGRALLDRDQLKQVLLNLVGNAIEASSAEGEVSIELRHDAARGDVSPEGPPLEALIVEVTDRGPGVAPKYVDRLFVPFFTTKPEGTGLGLAISEKIVRGHGGHLRYGRNRGRTIFRTVLPFVSSEAVGAMDGVGEPTLRAKG